MLTLTNHQTGSSTQVSYREFWRICSSGKAVEMRNKLLLPLQAINPKTKISYGDPSVRKALTEKDADDYYRTAWLKCCAKGDLECLQELMKYSQPDQIINREHDSAGNNGILICCKHGYLDCVKFLLTDCAMSTDAQYRNRLGETALSLAAGARRNSRELMELLVQQGCDANFKTFGGKTAALIAAELGRADVLRVLFDFRKSIVSDLATHRKAYVEEMEARSKAEAEQATAALEGGRTGSKSGGGGRRFGRKAAGPGPLSANVKMDTGKVSFYSKVLRCEEKDVADFFDGIVALELAEVRRDDYKALGEFIAELPSPKKGMEEERLAVEEEASIREDQAKREWRRLHSMHNEKLDKIRRVSERLVVPDEGDADDRTVLYISAKQATDRCFNLSLVAILDECQQQTDEGMRVAEIKAGRPVRVLQLFAEVQAVVKALAAAAVNKRGSKSKRASDAGANAAAAAAVSGSDKSAPPASDDGAAAAEEEAAVTAAATAAAAAAAAKTSSPELTAAIETKKAALAHTQSDLKRKEMALAAQKLNIPTKKGFTAAYVCSIYGHKTRLEALLKHRVALKPDVDGRSPLFVALAWETLPTASGAGSDAPAPGAGRPNECVEVLCAAMKKAAAKSKPPGPEADLSTDEIKALYSSCPEAEETFRTALRRVCGILQGSPRDSSRRYPGLVYYLDQDEGGVVSQFCSALAKYFTLPRANEGSALDEFVLEMANLTTIYMNNFFSIGEAKGLYSPSGLGSGSRSVGEPLAVVGGAVSSTVSATVSVMSSVASPFSFLNPLNLLSAPTVEQDPAYAPSAYADNQLFAQIIAVAAAAASAALGGCETNYQMSPLQWASQTGLVSCVKVLLSQPGVSAHPLPSRIASEDIALLLQEHRLIEAVQHGDLPMARQLLAVGGVDVNAVTHDGKTALHYACINGQLDLVKLLLADSRTAIDKTDSDGLTPLSCAARGSFDAFLYSWVGGLFGGFARLNLVLKAFTLRRPGAVRTRWLVAAAISRGGEGEGEGEEEEEEEEEQEDDEDGGGGSGEANVIVVVTDAEQAAVDKFLLTPAFIPGYSAPVDISQALDSMADDGSLSRIQLPIDPGSVGKAFMLQLAQRLWQGVAASGTASGGADGGSDNHGYNAITRLLLAHPNMTRDIVNRGDVNGMTALYLAASFGNEAVVDQLLCEPGISVNSADRDGDTPLIAAAARGHLGCVRLLLLRPEIDVNRAGNYGKMEPSQAGQTVRPESDKVIAEPGQRQAELRQAHKARLARRKEQAVLSVNGLVDGLTSFGEVFVPPETGQDPNRSLLNTALIAASSNGHALVVRRLLMFATIDVNRSNADGYTALGLAKSDEIRIMLREMGAEPTAADRAQMLLVHRRHTSAAIELVADKAPKKNSAVDTKQFKYRAICMNLVMPLAPPGYEAPPQPGQVMRGLPGIDPKVRVWVADSVLQSLADLDALQKLCLFEPLTQSSADPISPMFETHVLAALSAKLPMHLWYLDVPETWALVGGSSKATSAGVLDVGKLSLSEAMLCYMRFRVDLSLSSSLFCAAPLEALAVRVAVGSSVEAEDQPADGAPVFSMMWQSARAAQANAPTTRAIRRAVVELMLTPDVWGKVWAALPETAKGDLQVGEDLCHDNGYPKVPHTLPDARPPFELGFQWSAKGPFGNAYINVARGLCDKLQQQALVVLKAREKQAGGGGAAASAAAAAGGFAPDSVGGVAARLQALELAERNSKIKSDGGGWFATGGAGGGAALVDLAACN